MYHKSGHYYHKSEVFLFCFCIVSLFFQRRSFLLYCTNKKTCVSQRTFFILIHILFSMIAPLFHQHLIGNPILLRDLACIGFSLRRCNLHLIGTLCPFRMYDQ